MKDNDNLYIDRLFLTIPFDPINSFKREFLERLENFSLEHRKENKVATFEGKLDSLARLLEGKSICVATYIDKGKLIISSNKKLDKAYVEKVFALIGNKELSYSKVVLSLFDIIKQNFSQNERFLLNHLKDETGESLDTIVESMIHKTLLTFEPLKEALEQGDIDISEFHENFDSFHPVNKLLIKTVRLTRDFLKLWDPSFKPGNSNMDTLIKAIQKKNYEIINPSVKGLHAEVQIVIHTILNNHTQKIYIGISKLSCSHCTLLIETFNEIGYIMHYRGSHSKALGNWPLAQQFVEDLNFFSKFIGNKAFEIYSLMNPQEQQESIEFISGLGQYKRLELDSIRSVSKTSPIKQKHRKTEKLVSALEAGFSDSDEEVSENRSISYSEVDSISELPFKLMRNGVLTKVLDFISLEELADLYKKYQGEFSEFLEDLYNDSADDLLDEKGVEELFKLYQKVPHEEAFILWEYLRGNLEDDEADKQLMDARLGAHDESDKEELDFSDEDFNFDFSHLRLENDDLAIPGTIQDSVNISEM